MKKAQRQSNIELLRIVLMLMIIVHHIIVHGFGLKYIEQSNYLPSRSIYLELLINSFVVYAVNAFVFISGYFGMKFNVKTVVSFVLQALFYAFAIQLFFIYIGYSTFNSGSILNMFFPISRDVWWFLTAYLALYFIAPFLNKGIDSLEQKELALLLAAFLFFDCFSGFFFGTLSGMGYSFFHFITLYLLARYIKKYVADIKKAPLLWISLSLLLFGVTLVLLRFGKLPTIWLMFAYNNPLVIASAVMFFFVFKGFQLQSNIINLISGSVFGVYLVHDHYLVRDELAKFVALINTSYSGAYYALIIFALTLLIFLFGITVELVRKKVTDTLVDRITAVWKSSK